jgi:hypothetical protein
MACKDSYAAQIVELLHMIARLCGKSQAMKNL